MASTVYLETSIISYLAAYPSRDLITAAHQQITHSWWQLRRSEFSIFASQVVLDESALGDPEMARKRIEILAEVPLLDITPEVAELAATLITRLPLPPRAGADAAHIAVAAYHGMNFLLTWNCTHIANAVLRPKIERICREQGYSNTGALYTGRALGGSRKWLSKSLPLRCGSTLSSPRCGRPERPSLPRQTTTFMNFAGVWRKGRETLAMLS